MKDLMYYGISQSLSKSCTTSINEATENYKTKGQVLVLKNGFIDNSYIEEEND